MLKHTMQKALEPNLSSKASEQPVSKQLGEVAIVSAQGRPFTPPSVQVASNGLSSRHSTGASPVWAWPSTVP